MCEIFKETTCCPCCAKISKKLPRDRKNYVFQTMPRSVERCIALQNHQISYWHAIVITSFLPSYYFRITEFNIYNRNKLCIHAYFHKSATVYWAKISIFVKLVIVWPFILFATFDIQIPNSLCFRVPATIGNGIATAVIRTTEKQEQKHPK